MADKLASGAWSDGGPPSAGGGGGGDDRDQAEVARLTQKRDNARWTAVVGFAMLFAGGVLGAPVVIGGMLMAGYGTVVSFYWGRRIRRVKGDPWAYDPDLDGPHPGGPGAP
jgi:hypothetical protein